MKRTNSKLASVSFYVWCFYVCAFVGWVYESVWKSINRGYFYNSGFLHGYYLPIFGFGGLLLILALKKLMTKKWGNSFVQYVVKPVAMFVLITLVVSALEYFASVVLEILFDKRWWDYSYDKIHINGRVSLRNSSILGALGFVFVYLVYPLMKYFCGKVSNKVLNIGAVAIVTVILTDTVVTLIQMLLL